MRPIDADALARRAIEEKRFVFYQHDILRDEIVFRTVYKDLGEFIESAPTIDAVPVVRCGLCRYCDTKNCPMSGTPGSVSVSDFCSYGERRDDNA